MKKINRNQFQSFPYHLVEPSPWPILVSFSLLSLTLGAVMYMQGFNHGGQLISLGFTLTVFGMILWFRDIITEGTKNSNNLFSNLNTIFINKIIIRKTIKTLLSKYLVKEQPKNIRLNQLIEFVNNKYGTNIDQSPLNRSDLYSNSWFTGFIEADGHFGIKISQKTKQNDSRFKIEQCLSCIQIRYKKYTMSQLNLQWNL